MDDPKRSAAAPLKGGWIPSFKDILLSSLKSDRFLSLQVSFHPSRCLPLVRLVVVVVVVVVVVFIVMVVVSLVDEFAF